MRLIDADAAIEKLREYITEMESDVYYGSNLGIPEDYICEAIEDVPTIDAEPVRHGEWIYGENDIPHCSECGKEPKEISQYCPHCGANMGADNA